MTATGKQDTYTIDRLDIAAWRLPIPSTTQRLVIPDPGIFQHLETYDLPVSKVTLYSGDEVLVVRVPPGTTLTLYSLKLEDSGPAYALFKTPSP